MEPVSKKAYFKSESNIESNLQKITSITKNILNSKSPKNKFSNNKNSSLSRNNFEFIFIIGKGGFGKVWRVQEKKNKGIICIKGNVQNKNYR